MIENKYVSYYVMCKTNKKEYENMLRTNVFSNKLYQVYIKSVQEQYSDVLSRKKDLETLYNSQHTIDDVAMKRINMYNRHLNAFFTTTVMSMLNLYKAIGIDNPTYTSFDASTSFTTSSSVLRTSASGSQSFGDNTSLNTSFILFIFLDIWP